MSKNLLNFVNKYAKSIKHDLVLHLFLVLFDGCYEDVIIMINVAGGGGKVKQSPTAKFLMIYKCVENTDLGYHP